MGKGITSRSAAVSYAALLVAQTLVAGFLLWTMVPTFRRMVAHTGGFLDVQRNTVVAVLGGVVILQCCYWTRFRWIRCTRRCRAWSSHMSSCSPAAPASSSAGRSSQHYFSGTYLSCTLPPIAAGLANMTVALFALFALFCYSLELERLGRAIGELN